MSNLPSHKQLLLPVLHAVQSLGGPAAPCDVARKVAEDLELTDKLEHYRGKVSGREIDLFSRRIRWVRQDGIRRGFLNAASYGVWELTAPGKNFIGNIKPDIVITIYETDRGIALWGHAEAAGALIADNSINLILTSPEFPLLKEKKLRQSKRNRLSKLAHGPRPRMETNARRLRIARSRIRRQVINRSLTSIFRILPSASRTFADLW